jgi:UrcA family protein
MKTTLCGTLLGVLILSVSTLAAARLPEDTAPTRIVSFRDLDLTRIDGVTMLYRRIRQAARQVCTPSQTPDLAYAELMQRCEENAIAQAVADVNSPLLTSYHQERARPLTLSVAQH